MEKVEKRKYGFGIGEWAKRTVNIGFGCPHDCGYCFAKMFAIRFKRKTEETWKVMELNFKAINKGYRKIKNDDPNIYDVMFPSSHDILPEILDNYLIVLKKLLKAGNSVLIVSKPWPFCIEKITNTVRKYKDRIGFRFTITSTNKARLAFWQPNAPGYDDMMTSLIIAFVKGFTTSVSIEPNLDSDPTRLILKVAPYVTESIWFGIMNYIKAEGITEEEKPFYIYQRKISSWAHIQKIVEKIKLLPEDVKSKIRIKDSIVKMYKKHGIEAKI
jgi:DNA repair photolyase